MIKWPARLMVATVVSLAAPPALAETCTREQVRKVVDDTGAALRRINAENRQRLDAGLKRLKDKNGWSDDEYLEKANTLLADARSEALDTTATDLLGKLDRLGEDTPSGEPDCSKLGELEATSLELQAAVRVKMQHTLARLDQLTGEPAKATSPANPPAVVPVPKKDVAAATPPPPAAKAPPAKAPPPQKGWNTSTVEDQTRSPPPPTVPLPPSAGRPMPPMPAETDGFSKDEISEATRGFFGTVSAGLASVIEHSFSKLGRPTAYVLGNEGGGAFIAGVRFGKGTLFTRGGKSREVHWHGPSIGYDFGASGSKALFLVYNLRDELDIFTGFSGVEGSAYFVGGVGMTVLTDGRIVMAPIRSGVGLRFGANIGYLRFTARPTWNPF